MKSKILAVTVILATLLSVGSLGAGAPEQERTVLEGIFTQEQAGRGRELVIKIGCAGCHNSDLGGGLEETPSLIGNEFIAVWNGLYLKDLDSQMTSMPSDGSYKLNPQERVDVIAFLLGINGVPLGNTELQPDPDLFAKMRIRFP